MNKKGHLYKVDGMLRSKCSVCHQMPRKPPVYACNAGHFYCQSCYLAIGDVSDSSKCSKCSLAEEIRSLSSKESVFKECLGIPPIMIPPIPRSMPRMTSEMESGDFTDLSAMVKLGTNFNPEFSLFPSTTSFPRSCHSDSDYAETQSRSSYKAPTESSVLSFSTGYPSPSTSNTSVLTIKPRINITDVISTQSVRQLTPRSPQMMDSPDSTPRNVDVDDPSNRMAVVVYRTIGELTAWAERRSANNPDFPINCPVSNCGTTDQYILVLEHFADEHPSVREYDVTRGQHLTVTCDLELSPMTQSQICLAKIVVRKPQRERKRDLVHRSYFQKISRKCTVLFMRTCATVGDKTSVDFWFATNSYFEHFWIITSLVSDTDVTMRARCPTSHPDDSGGNFKIEEPRLTIKLDKIHKHAKTTGDGLVQFNMRF